VWSPAANIGTKATAKILSLCDLSEKSHLIAGELSQGDKKKLELAIALSAKPLLLLLDEPTAGMSSEETTDTMRLVDRLNDEFNLTILFTEHDMSVVFNHALRIALLHHGHIACEGNSEEIRNNELVQRIYLGEENS
jgi:branched-chain amino acid transport system ATP-binding protein